jgi:hypothetical protein
MRSLVTLLAALAAACMTSTAPTVPLNRDFTLAPGALIVVDETSLGIRFVGVSGDSRCPADALCIQGGDATVRIEVHPTRGEPSTYALHTGSMRPVTYGRHVIALVQLAPYPFSSRTIKPEEYRATLRVTRP